MPRVTGAADPLLSKTFLGVLRLLRWVIFELSVADEGLTVQILAFCGILMADFGVFGLGPLGRLSACLSFRADLVGISENTAPPPQNLES